MNETNVPDPWAVSITENNIGTLTLSGFPKTAGCWRISGDFHVHVSKRPNWFHSKMTKLLLGWEWVDA